MPLTPVSDPSILAALDGGGDVPVSDPALLAALEGEDDGFLSRVGERFEERQAEVGQTQQALAAGEIKGPEAMLQIFGKGVAGTAIDVLGEGLVSTARGLSAMTPDAIEKPLVDNIKKGYDFLVSTPPGQDALEAIDGGMEAYGEWKRENPRFAKNLESTTNLGLLLAPAKTKANASPSRLSQLSERLEGTAKRRAGLNRKTFTDDLVRAPRTQKVLLDEVPRTTEKGKGIFKRSVVALSQSEKAAAAEVRNIGKVSPKNTLQGNRNIIAAHNSKLASRLESKLEKEIGSINPDVLTQRITATIDDLVKNNPTIVGDPALAAKANLVSKKAMEFIAEQGGTRPVDILRARKKLDRWLLNNKQNFFDSPVNSTLSESGRAVRKEMNGLVDDFAHNTDVHNSLKRQTRLYNALDNIELKARNEGNNAIKRQWDNLSRALPFRNKAIQDMALLTGMGGLGAAATFAPVIAKGFAAGAIVYGTRKAVMHPRTAQALSKMVGATDEALRTTKNPSMIKQLRADRALIVELLDNVETDPSMPLAFGQQDTSIQEK